MNNIEEELTCPITLELLEDPICLPCCGRAVSRESMLKITNQECPLCRSDTSNFDIINAPKIINIAYMVDAIKNKDNITELFNSVNDVWKGKLFKLEKINKPFLSSIGRLKIINKNYKSNIKSLIILVIDTSGSMAGNPINQVKYTLSNALEMTYGKEYIIMDIIKYDSSASIINIDKKNNMQFYKSIINNINAGGGTNFNSAFREIVKLITNYNSNNNIDNVSILFLTDGEDSNAKNHLDDFKKTLHNVWKKNIIIHSIGFGSSHDYELLTLISKLGTEDGAYRYADPNEDSESLSNKINSVLDVISKSPKLPVEIISCSAPILCCVNSTYWLNLKNIEKYECVIKVNNEEKKLIIENDEEEKEEDIWNEWYNNLIDQIASELLNLTNNKIEDLDSQIHLELLEKRSKTIFSELLLNKGETNRLEKILDNIKKLKSGYEINKAKINDMMFEGKFKTKITIKKEPQLTIENIEKQQQSIKKKSWEIFDYDKFKRNNYSSSQLFDSLFKLSTTETLNYINNNNNIDDIDNNGSNILMVAASIGNIKIIETIISLNKIDINQVNNYGCSALDLAILYGYWISTEILIKAGCKNFIDADILLRSCMSKLYFNTADKLINYKIAFVKNEMIDNTNNIQVLNWLSSRNDTSQSIETAIIKGMIDVVKNNIDLVKNFSWSNFLDILIKPTNNHLEIFELLLSKNIADVDEIININDDITFPLFISCERGNYPLFKMIMSYSKNLINKTNNKGTTSLWIACCNNNLDIITELLVNNADPNITNIKGDNCLIPACQKGHKDVVMLLIEAGINICNKNKNGDNSILISCRTGQYNILEKLLSSLNKDEIKKILEEKAIIDGFNPLFAAVEQDRTECIKICCKFGANIESRTDKDNQIIKNSTPLHLAVFYNKVASLILLLSLGADINAKDNDGNCALHLAIKHGNIDCVRILFDKSEKDIFNNEGKLPIDYAKMKGNELLYEEFFIDKFMTLTKVINSDNDIEKKCAYVLQKYGNSIGCYENDNLLKIRYDNGENLLTCAIINGNKYLIEMLKDSNMDFPDHFGIKPSFWGVLMGYNFKCDEQIQIMLDRLEKVKHNNFQNKLLLNVQSQKLLLIDNKTNYNMKMLDGFNYNQNNSALIDIKKNISESHSLLSFIDKIKKINKQSTLESLIYEARLNAVKLIALGETILSPAQLISIYLYTGNEEIFKKVNEMLLNWNKNDIWSPFIFTLYQSIKLIEDYQQEVYKSVDIKFIKNDYKIGNVLVWNFFSVCYSHWKNNLDMINNKCGIVFIIKSKNGKNISKYSKYPIDSEIIFLPESKFKITNIYKPNIFVFGQKNIRESTYIANEKDIEKAENGKSSIIIELEEF